MISFPLVQYALTAAVRDKVLYALAAGVILSCVMSIFMGGVAIVEQDYFAIVFTASGLRFMVVLGLVMFVVFYVRRSFDTKDVEFLLSRPISRVSYIVSHVIAFIVIAFMMACLQALALYMVGGHLFGAGHWLWIASVFAENIMMVSLALFFSLYLSSATTSALACFGFYALARMLGTVLGSLDKGMQGGAFEFVGGLMNGISLIVPRLDLMAQSSWLIYGIKDVQDIVIVVAQTLTFTAVVMAATMIDLVRREF